jgi:ribosomal protein L25 (general stress protein Ctc)
MPSAKAHAIVADALKSYARSSEYREAVAVPGAWRFDLDGKPVEPVATEHAEFAQKIKTQRPTGPAKESIAVKVSGIKITVPLPADQLQVVAETVKTVDLTLDLGDGKPFLVPFSGKNFRRALRQADEVRASGAEVIVVLQGRLVAGHRVEGAGLAVQAKAVKEPAS